MKRVRPLLEDIRNVSNPRYEIDGLPRSKRLKHHSLLLTCLRVRYLFLLRDPGQVWSTQHGEMYNKGTFIPPKSDDEDGTKKFT